MKKTIEIIMPESWAEITLKQYLELAKELENYKDDTEAQTAVLLYKLCGLEPAMVDGISKSTYEALKYDLQMFMNIIELPLQRIIKVGGVEYGIEPNLSQISYGAYADISKYPTIQIDENWAKVMSILYRPIASKKGETYLIEPYDGNVDYTKWLNVGMDIHFGCLFFFVRLSTDLLSYTLNSTMEMEMPDNYKSILVKNGALMQRLLNSLTETSHKLIK
jgi:hypothetical protein